MLKVPFLSFENIRVYGGIVKTQADILMLQLFGLEIRRVWNNRDNKIRIGFILVLLLRNNIVFLKHRLQLEK